MKNEEVIAKFLQTEYSDQALCNLLCTAEDGKMCFASPGRCLLGLSDARYSDFRMISSLTHDERNKAEDAFLYISDTRGKWYSKWYQLWRPQSDKQRNAAMLPIIRAEIARRDKERETAFEIQSTPEIRVRVKSAL